MKIKFICRYWRAGLYSLYGTIVGLLLSIPSFILYADGEGPDVGIKLLFFWGIPVSFYLQWPLYGFFIGLARNKKSQLRSLYIILAIHVILVYLVAP